MPNPYAIFTDIQLSADPNYDPLANKPWWELAWNAVVNWFVGIINWYNGLSWESKVFCGVVFLGAAVALTALFPGTAGVWASLEGLFAGMLLSIAWSVAAYGLIGLISGEEFSLNGLRDAIADGILWGGIFAFVSASVNAIKAISRTLSTRGRIKTDLSGAKNCQKVGECFIAGTLVETEDGLKPIEEIQVGDKVLAYDEDTGEQGYKEVVRLFRNQTKEWYHVFVNGEEIVCTSGHPFYVVGKGFIPARELQVGQILKLADCTAVFIDKITVERLESPETTYNFEVADFHTYYVTDSKVLVHNKCTTDLYRAMSNEEYGSLMKHNKFKHKLGTMQDKWMATSYDDAVKWGNTLLGEGNFRIVKIKVPTSSLKNMHLADYALDGIGRAYCAHYQYLNEVMINFVRVL